MSNSVDDLINSSMPTVQEIADDLVMSFRCLQLLTLEDRVKVINSDEFTEALKIMEALGAELRKLK